MTEYVNKKELLDSLEKKIKESNKYRMAVVDSDFIDLVNDATEIDVAPVVHGEWIFVDNDETGYQVKCSHCGTEFTFPAKKHLTKHCPECGAKMDGGKSGTAVVEKGNSL